MLHFFINILLALLLGEDLIEVEMVALQISTLVRLQHDLMLVRDRNLLFNQSERLTSAFISFEVIRQNGSDSGEDSDVALKFEELVKKTPLKGRVELLFAHHHFLLASL